MNRHERLATFVGENFQTDMLFIMLNENFAILHSFPG
jgi:hypothetical protein